MEGSRRFSLKYLPEDLFVYKEKPKRAVFKKQFVSIEKEKLTIPNQILPRSFSRRS